MGRVCYLRGAEQTCCARQRKDRVDAGTDFSTAADGGGVLGVDELEKTIGWRGWADNGKGKERGADERTRAAAGQSGKERRGAPAGGPWSSAQEEATRGEGRAGPMRWAKGSWRRERATAKGRVGCCSTLGHAREKKTGGPRGIERERREFSFSLFFFFSFLISNPIQIKFKYSFKYTSLFK